MSARYFKLGLFTLITLAATVTVAVLLGMRTEPTETFHVYFDESVQGLEVGALVKYRGVRIGSVRSIQVAEDRRHVDVAMNVERSSAQQLRLVDLEPSLRARLVLIGITGLREVDISPQPNASPVAIPTFATGYAIPARPSLGREVEVLFDRVRDQVPAALDRTVAVLDQLQTMVEDAKNSELARNLGEASKKLDSILDQIGGRRGLVGSAKRASESVNDVGKTVRDSMGDIGRSARDLEVVLREIREAARSVNEFFQDLDRQPDMLLKGRARRGR